jgi:hypothetical protein
MRRLMTILALLLTACGDADPHPHAAVVATAPLELDPADDLLDDLTITIDYSDGDGDLGDGTVEVHDCRADDLVVALPVPPIANMEAVDDGVAIEGTIHVVVTDVGLVDLAAAAPAACAELGIGAPAAGEAIFCVRLIDAAGRSGDGDCTPPVAILGE